MSDVHDRAADALESVPEHFAMPDERCEAHLKALAAELREAGQRCAPIGNANPASVAIALESATDALDFHGEDFGGVEDVFDGLRKIYEAIAAEAAENETGATDV